MIYRMRHLIREEAMALLASMPNGLAWPARQLERREAEEHILSILSAGEMRRWLNRPSRLRH